jgi:hypothetical protein
MDGSGRTIKVVIDDTTFTVYLTAKGRLGFCRPGLDVSSETLEQIKKIAREELDFRRQSAITLDAG